MIDGGLYGITKQILLLVFFSSLFSRQQSDCVKVTLRRVSLAPNKFQAEDNSKMSSLSMTDKQLKGVSQWEKQKGKK
jgi:hypothetical protein